MRLVQAEEIEASNGRRRLLSGDEGLPGHYELSLQQARREEKRRRRRHGYDHVWFDLVDEVRYVSEGTFYDPRELACDSHALVLRCGGASGNGYARGRHEDCAQPRYERPVVVDAADLSWLPSAGGVQRKFLGVFSERGLKIGLMRMAAGACAVVAGQGAPRVLYSLRGGGTVNGRRWRDGTALGISPAEAVILRADEESEWFFVRLQRFDA